MIEPNFSLMLWVIYIMLGLRAISMIISGAVGMEKDKKYNALDTIAGLIGLGLMIWVTFG